MECIKDFKTLKTHKDFQRVYNRAKKWHTPAFILFYQESLDKKIGFTATKKIGNAVKRNRGKRVLRALFSQFSDSLLSGTYVFVAKDSLNTTTHKELVSNFKWATKKLHILKTTSKE